MLGRKVPLAPERAPLQPRRFTIARKIDPDAHPDSIERPKRRTRRAPKGRQNVTRLVGDDGEAASGSALRRLQERGFVHDIVGELKSGKEATVYLGRSPLGDVAVKIFRDIEVRSFKSDQRYLEGRWVATPVWRRPSGAARAAACGPSRPCGRRTST
jgi:serine/threonine-protein kinase RIO1